MKVQLKRSKLESLSTTLIWISIWVLTISTRITRTPGGGHYLLKNSQQLRALFGPGDAGSLLEVAQTWSSFKSLNPDTQFWIVRLWSPGLPIIEVPMLWIEKLGVPIYMSFMAAVLLIWGTAFYLFWRYFSPLIGRLICVLIAALTYISWDFNYFFVEGLFNTEGIGYCLLIISLMGLFYNLVIKRDKSKKTTVIFGIVFGIAIWVRHTNDVTLLFSGTVFSLLLILKYFVSKVKKPIHRKSINRSLFLQDTMFLNLKRLCVFFAIAGIVTLPWRIIAPTVFDGASGLMSSGGISVISSDVWATPESVSGKYWGAYGSNWACKIDQKQCSEISSADNKATLSSSHLMLLATKAAISNPLSYFKERLSFAEKLSNPLASSNFKFGRSASFLNLGFIFLNGYYFRKIPKANRIQVFLIWAPFILLTILQLMWIHFEPRYFIPLRMGLLGMLLSMLALCGAAKAEERSSQKIEN